MKTELSTTRLTPRQRGAKRLLVPVLAGLLLLALPGCETPGPEREPSDYPDPGHPNSPDPDPAW